MVVALTAARALRLSSVAVVNVYDDRDCAKSMEVCTGPAANGPWTSVATFTSAKTKERQTFAAAPDAPALGGFVQVLVHDTSATPVLTKCRWRARRGSRGMRRRGAQHGGAGGPRAATHRACGHRARSPAPSRPTQPGTRAWHATADARGAPGAEPTQPPGNVQATVVIAE